jgi:Fe-Mn family superoxide dismutase
MDINNLAIGPKSWDYIQELMAGPYVQLHFEGHHVQYQKKLLEYFNNNPWVLSSVINYNKPVIDNSYHPLNNNINQQFLEKIITYSLEINNQFLYNNAAQIWNHNLLWASFTTNTMVNLESFLQTQCPTIYQQIIKDFITFNGFLEQLITAHEKVFGNIWVWIAWNAIEKKMEIKVSGNAGSLAHYQFIKPLLVIDLWEHAYYGQYQNKKMEYINKMIGFLNWSLADSMIKNFL